MIFKGSLLVVLFVQDTLVAIRVTLPEKDEDTDEPSPAESLQMAVRLSMCFCHFSRCTSLIFLYCVGNSLAHSVPSWFIAS